MFDESTKIVLSNEGSVGIGIWFEDISSSMLSVTNTDATRFNTNNYLYIGHPTKFNQLSVVLATGYTINSSTLTVSYYKGGASPGWTSIPATAITNNTSGEGVANSTFRRDGTIYLKETTWYSSWITNSVASIPNLYWTRLTFSSGSTYLMNMFNYLSDFENITTGELGLIDLTPVYITALRPNRMIMGD